MRVSTNIVNQKPKWPYLSLMKDFTIKSQQKCRAVPTDMRKNQRTKQQFPTGSHYHGFWNTLGINGVGTYKFTNGVVYVGEFEDGLFHGNGEFRYPNGDILKGRFRYGRAMERTLIFADGLQYSDVNWKYCQMPDRRFTIEYENGLKPVNECYITANQPPRKIPPGCYDTEDGFFNPKSEMVYEDEGLTKIKRCLCVAEQRWTVENCRKDYMDHADFGKELYEEWLEPQLVQGEVPIPPEPCRATEYMEDSVVSLTSMDMDGDSKYWSWAGERHFSSQICETPPPLCD